MLDLGFFVLCGFVGMVPTVAALMFKRPGLGACLAGAWFALSTIALRMIGLGPHGFILFAFIPFWSGNVVALIWALIRFNKERGVV